MLQKKVVVKAGSTSIGGKINGLSIQCLSAAATMGISAREEMGCAMKMPKEVRERDMGTAVNERRTWLVHTTGSRIPQSS